MSGTMGGRASIPAYLTTGRITTVTTLTPTQTDACVHTVTWANIATAGTLIVTSLKNGVVACVAIPNSVSGSQLYDVYCPGGFSVTTSGTGIDFSVTYALVPGA